ncbi:hypothetical protein ACQZV8_14840, partial [Magnetococcales bacterium HHB-1]
MIRFFLLLSILLSWPQQGVGDAYDDAVLDYAMGYYELSFRTFSTLAQKEDHSGAQYYLGELYAAGRGVEKSSDQALHWLRKSAATGYQAARNRLGEVYRDGLMGVEKDSVRALSYFLQSSYAGKENLHQLQSQMSDVSICQAVEICQREGDINAIPETFMKLCDVKPHQEKKIAMQPGALGGPPNRKGEDIPSEPVAFIEGQEIETLLLAETGKKTTSVTGAVKKHEPVVAKKPEPVVAKKPEPVVAKKPEPVVAKKPEPVVAKKPEPVVAKKPEPVVAKKPEPVVAKKPEPVVAKKPEPVVAKKPEPVVAKKPEPVVAKKPEPVVAKKPEPVVAKKPEPVVAKKPEPVVAKKPEPVVA